MKIITDLLFESEGENDRKDFGEHSMDLVAALLGLPIAMSFSSIVGAWGPANGDTSIIEVIEFVFGVIFVVIIFSMSLIVYGYFFVKWNHYSKNKNPSIYAVVPSFLFTIIAILFIGQSVELNGRAPSVSTFHESLLDSRFSVAICVVMIMVLFVSLFVFISMFGDEERCSAKDIVDVLEVRPYKMPITAWVFVIVPLSVMVVLWIFYGVKLFT